VKLAYDDVILIRELLIEKEKRKAEYMALVNEKIAEKFDVSRRAIDRIENGETWR